MLVYHRNLHHRHKFSKEHTKADIVHSNMDYFFSFVLFVTEGGKRGNITNCGNGSWKSLLPHGLTSCALNDETKVETVLFRK